MRLFFVLALLSTLGSVYLYQRNNELQLKKFRQQRQDVEEEIRQCREAERAIRRDRHRLAGLKADNKRLQALLKTRHK
ncbi:MAG: hypothetical protein KF760_29800 [Candidatus Eremiobacteraeota bacterium]|nr:hypothetical protein [Candidatus Eremiobacteraeota bacterium]MCW5866923.1 hypothetical protein [Candidatus Eremiobacteraeota bacterium]